MYILERAAKSHQVDEVHLPSASEMSCSDGSHGVNVKPLIAAMRALREALDRLANKLVWDVGEVLTDRLEGDFHTIVLMAFMHSDNHTEPVIGLDYLPVREIQAIVSVLNALLLHTLNEDLRAFASSRISLTDNVLALVGPSL
jgi:hypothetical protein